MTDEQVQATGMLTEYQNQQKSAALYMADVVHWEVELQKTEAYQQLQKAKQALANADTLLKEKEKGVIDSMLSFNLKTLETFDTRITLKKSPGSVVVTNEEVIPEEYKKQKVTISLDKKKISEDIKSGKDVFGCALEHSWTLLITKKDDMLSA